MSYKDTDKQREFQRNWYRKKKAQRSIEEEPTKAPKINQQILTSKELKQLTTSIEDSCSNWEECISIAKDFIGSKRTDRLALATLATEAVRIRHGGNRRTAEWRTEYGRTLADFAAEIGINAKTLSEWVAIKREIADPLIEIDESFDMATAQLAIRYKIKSSRLDRYLELWRDGSKRRAIRLLKCIQDVQNYLSKKGVLEALTSEQLDKIKASLEQTWQILNVLPNIPKAKLVCIEEKNEDRI